MRFLYMAKSNCLHISLFAMLANDKTLLSYAKSRKNDYLPLEWNAKSVLCYPWNILQYQNVDVLHVSWIYTKRQTKGTSGYKSSCWARSYSFSVSACLNVMLENISHIDISQHTILLLIFSMPQVKLEDNQRGNQKP